MATFTYNPIDLNTSAFRLVRLLKGNGYEIYCELIDATLDNDALISYEAISYTWGQDEGVYSSVYIQGRSLKIRLNLWNILHDIRQSTKDRYLWIDAISIDQTNDKERRHQVERMRDIYSRAERVLFCLSMPSAGPTSPTTIFLESLINLQNQTRGVFWSLTDQRWKVAWVKVQDMHQHRYGGDWKTFWTTHGSEEFGSYKKLRMRRGPQYALVATPYHRAVVNLMPGPDRFFSRVSNGGFYCILIQFAKSEASDERDKIFALQGLWADKNLPKPDYTISNEDIMRRTNNYLFDGNSFKDLPEVNLVPKGIDEYLSIDPYGTLRGPREFVRSKETSEIHEDADCKMRIAKIILQPGQAEVIIDVDLAELRELLLFVPNEMVGLAVKMVIGKNNEAQFIINELLQSFILLEKEFHRNDMIEIFIRRGEEEVIELLAVAAKLGVDEVVESLVRKGANVERRSQSGFTAFGSAIMFGRETTTQLLVEAGARISGYDYCLPPLVAAVCSRRHAIATLLLDMGADIEARGSPDSPHLTALCAAVLSSDLRMVQLLLSRNANPNTLSVWLWGVNGYQPYDIAPLNLAMACENASIIATLQEAGAEAINYRN
ncbi:hypothetical protein O1611_g3252 [Lasiodiplodia mahajangana]|uniref:Uncharacterized protein n=1 Tax=Lasiodiplodia mahajangana TaxID=1108764 RepID=A0ACC2JT02_9PEZI|nr:hypothetical protein O1611_g3252 [Lasiodiplodia mahajangana]